MGRNILFITTDQQRWDSLGCNGGTIARTPTIDSLAAAGFNYSRAYNQNTVCMPARSSMLTGQYVRTHGVVANGIPLPEDAPSVAAYLHDVAGYRTALLGKAHFEPGWDPQLRWAENRRPSEGDTGPWRGFETAVNVMHTAIYPGGRPASHYGYWIEQHHPEHLKSYAPLLSAKGGGDTSAPETKNNPIPRDWYHTDWVADQTIAWLDSVRADEDWFCWMSFPDPHHPWDPPESELGRVRWQDLDLPPGHPGSPDEIREVLARKPRHWLEYYEGTWANIEGGPASFKPASMTDDQIREINAKTHVMNELIDEACARVLAALEAKGVLDDTDIFFTTDHGELQGDFGLIFKGPFHVDALMRLPFIWRPAPTAAVPGVGVVVTDPVGQIDLAPTFCSIAGVDPGSWMQGAALPTRDGTPGRERAITEWDSQFPNYGMHMRSIYRDGWMCTVYEPSTGGQPNGLEKVELMTQLFGDALTKPGGVQYDGTEGELYHLDDDPVQFHNRWDDPACASLKSDLVADLYDTLKPIPVTTLEVEAPA